VGLTIVIDANIALATALPLPYSPDADRWIDRWKAERAVLLAPVLWTYEVTSGLRRAVFEKILDPGELEEALMLVDAMDLELTAPSPELTRASLRWADRLGQNKAYDGCYLAVAEQSGAQFFTADKRLANALADRDVPWAHWIGESDEA
jgi:predicted nucleic acid-binding protein